LQAQSFDDYFRESTTRYLYGYLPGDDWRWLKAQAIQESSLNPFAVSSAGASGLLQLMPGAAQDAGLSWADRFDARKNVRAGAWILRRNIRVWWPRDTRFQRLQLGWAGYNAGAGWILKAQARSNGARLWSDIAPHLWAVTGHIHSMETIRYVAIIPSHYQGLIAESAYLPGAVFIAYRWRF